MFTNFDKPMSTKVYFGCINFFVFIGFVLLCNPISMFVIQLFAPVWAYQLAHSKVLCGDWSCGVYTHWATRWPFFWSKYWLSPEQIKDCSRQKQLEYFFNVRRDQETVDVLQPEALQRLIKYSPKAIEEIIMSMKLSDRLFSQILNSYLIDELKHYLWRGTLPKAQQKCLLEKALVDSQNNLEASSVKLFLEYVERCGLSNEMLKQAQKSKVPAFKAKVTLAQKCYVQKCMVKKCVELNTKEAEAEWAKFLKKEGGLCYNASLLMTSKEYLVFHKLGLTLLPEVIEYFFKWRAEQEITAHIMRNEPKHGIVNAQMAKLVENSEILQALYQSILAEEK